MRRTQTCRDSLPDLTKLTITTPEPVSATLWEFLANPATANAKDPACDHHGPLIDGDKTNCAIDGYLMHRRLPTTDTAVDGASMLGNDITVPTEEGDRVMRALPSRKLKKLTIRKRRFLDKNEIWIAENFNARCLQGYDHETDDQGQKLYDADGDPKMIERGVVWWKFADDLIDMTDWFYLDKLDRPGRMASDEEQQTYKQAVEAGKENRGLVFVRLFSTTEEKQQAKLPHEGLCGGVYLYVTLVCAAGHKGYGNQLIKMAHALAGQLGCDSVVLSTLPDPNTAGFYYSKYDYRFVNRSGQMIDIADTSWVTQTDEGRTILSPDIDDADAADSGPSNSKQAVPTGRESRRTIAKRPRRNNTGQREDGGAGIDWRKRLGLVSRLVAMIVSL